MKDLNCIFISAYKQTFNNEVSYRISFVGVDTYKGVQTIGIDASCSEEDYDKVKKLEFGASPLRIIYTKSAKGNYYKVEEVLSVPDPEPEIPSVDSIGKK